MALASRFYAVECSLRAAFGSASLRAGPSSPNDVSRSMVTRCVFSCTSRSKVKRAQMSRLLIYGDGGFGRELLMALSQIDAKDMPGTPVFIDDASDSTEHAGTRVIRFSDVEAEDHYVLAVGTSRIREKLDERCRGAGLKPWTLIAPSAEIGISVEVGSGAVFCGNATVTGFCKIGRQFQCNIYSYVAHDCIIGDYVTFAPRVCCNGNVHIGDHAYIGTGAILKQGSPDKPLVIGEGAVVGMGAVVTKDVAPFTTVIGNPARPLERSVPGPAR